MFTRFWEKLTSENVSRRDWLRTGGAFGLAGLLGSAAVTVEDRAQAQGSSEGGSGSAETSRGGGQLEGAYGPPETGSTGRPHGQMKTQGTVDHEANGFDPMEMLYDFDYGEVSATADGRTLREYSVVARDREIEVAPGVYFPAWTYEGRVPGPTFRAQEGDRIRIRFANGGSHPHTIHFHGIHGASQDGVPGAGDGMIDPGESTVYEFDAAPFGCHLYHCHSIPLKDHIHRGLYGGFIVDPDPERYEGPERELARRRNHRYPECEEVHEMVMVMNGFDTNYDGDNEIYAANTVAFAFVDREIPVRHDERIRVYLINTTEFDPVNSFHLHANFFDYYDHGTTLEPTRRTVDTIMQCQAQRGILEFDFEGFEPGSYMFHAHQSEFAELGWMGFFEVQNESYAA